MNQDIHNVPQQYNLREILMQWRSDYDFGILDRRNVVQVCDDIIKYSNDPPYEIIELSLMGAASEADMCMHMRTLCPDLPKVQHRYRSLQKAMHATDLIPRLSEIQAMTAMMVKEFRNVLPPSLIGAIFNLELYVVNNCLINGTVTVECIQEVLADIKTIVAEEESKYNGIYL
jgi:hypothetical protein